MDLGSLYEFALRTKPPGAGKVVFGIGRQNPRFPYRVRIVLTRRGTAVACPEESTLARAQRVLTPDLLRRMGRSARAAQRALREFGVRDVLVDGRFSTREGEFRPCCDHDVLRLKPSAADGPALGEAYVVMDGEEIACRGLLLASSDCPGACEIANIRTEPRFRRRGMARSVASEIASDILKRGAVPVFTCSLSNTASLAIRRSLGFRRFATEITGMGP